MTTEGPATPEPTTPEPTTPDASAPSSSSKPGPPASTPGRQNLTSKDMLALATADLAEKLKVDPSDIAVVTNEEVTWRDGSLGCAQKGRAYITMLVAGHLIVLEAAGKKYEYHAARASAPFLCENPQEPLPPGSTGT